MAKATALVDSTHRPCLPSRKLCRTKRLWVSGGPGGGGLGRTPFLNSSSQPQVQRAPQAQGLGVKTQLPSIQGKELPLCVEPQCHLLYILGEKTPHLAQHVAD